MCGVAGEAVVEAMPLFRTDELEAPGQFGGNTENLGVHKVADANEASNKCNGNGEAVECPERVAPGGEYGEQYYGDNDAYGASVAGETALPGGKYLPRVRRIVVPLVEEYMTEACADNGSHTYIYEQDAEPAFGDAFALEHAGYYIKANPKSDGEHQSVPAYGDKAVDNVGIDIPCDKRGKHSLRN